MFVDGALDTHSHWFAVCAYGMDVVGFLELLFKLDESIWMYPYGMQCAFFVMQLFDLLLYLEYKSVHAIPCFVPPLNRSSGDGL